MVSSEHPPLIHRPAPRPVVYAAMAFLALIGLPAFFLPPKPIFTASAASGGELRLLSVRWPLGTRTFDVPIADVRDVVLQRSPRSPAVRIVFAMHDGRELPVTTSYFGNLGHMEPDASALRALIG